MTDPQTDPLMAFILGVLAPLLKTSNAAMQQMIAAYQVTSPNQLITVAEILGFSLTSLDMLRLSLPEDLSLSMKLRLRGNANTLIRSSQRAAATLQTKRTASPPRPTAPPEQSPQKRPEAPPTDQHAQRDRDIAWANGMTTVAAEFSAELAKLPPEQRHAHLSRIAALTRTAGDLRRDDIPLKSRLLNSTSISR